MLVNVTFFKYNNERLYGTVSKEDHEPLGLLCFFATAHRGLRTWTGTITCSTCSVTEVKEKNSKKEREEFEDCRRK